MNTTNVPAVADTFKGEAHQNTTSPQSYCHRIQKLLRNMSCYFTLLLYNISRLAVWHTHPPTEWVMVTTCISAGKRRHVVKLVTHPRVVLRRRTESYGLQKEIYHYLYLPTQLIICLLPEVYFTYGALGAQFVYLYSDYVFNISHYIPSKDKKNNELSSIWEEAASTNLKYSFCACLRVVSKTARILIYDVWLLGQEGNFLPPGYPLK
jgi:hypothetical protein